MLLGELMALVLGWQGDSTHPVALHGADPSASRDLQGLADRVGLILLCKKAADPAATEARAWQAAGRR